MKQSIEKEESRRVYEPPKERVVELETHGRLLQASQIPFGDIPVIPD